VWRFFQKLLGRMRGGAREDAPNRLPDGVRDVLANADRFELLSLDPGNGTTREPGHFWGWPVLGSATIEAPDMRAEVLAALEQGIAENEGLVAACFMPRHGIRAARGGAAVDLLVCFECLQVYVYSDGKWVGTVLVMDSPEPVFDRILSRAGVPLAPKLAEHEDQGGPEARPSGQDRRIPELGQDDF
jgi:hypothetical protein